MRARSLLLLLLALGCGLVASYGITQVIANRNAEPADTGEKQGILVAKKDIPMGEPISAPLVSLESRPTAYVPAGAFSNLADAEGRRARTPIPANTPITEALLLGKGAGDQLASNGIPLGMRLATVKVDPQSAAGNLVRPGDCVDVLVYVKADPMRGIARTATRTILQNLRVYAVNDVWEATTGDKSLNAKTISLIVSAEEAEFITLATELGTVRLVLRSPDDKEIKSLTGKDSQELLGGTLPSGGDRDKAKTDVREILKDLVAPPKPAAPPAAVATAPAEEPAKTFTVRILAGSRVTDTVLEAAVPPKGSKESCSQFELWKIGPSAPSPAPASQGYAPAMPPAVGPPIDQPPVDPPATDDGKAGRQEKAGAKAEKRDTKGDQTKL
jgi:pilus assembly protein CpaB